jgi:hypothetical protein
MNGQCLGCTRHGAAPGSGAVGDVDDDSSDVDVWTMDGSGKIANVKSDCD